MTQEEKARAFDEFLSKVEKMMTLEKTFQKHIETGNMGLAEDILDSLEIATNEVDTMIEFYKENINDTTASTAAQ